MNNDKKIFLVINTGYLGDVILTSKLTRDIKKEYPDCLLVFVADAPCVPAAKGLPGVDEVICYNRKKCQNIFHFIKFWIDFPYKFKIDCSFIPNGRNTNRLFLAQSLGSKKIFQLANIKIPFSYSELLTKNPLNDRFSYWAANMLSAITGKLTDDTDIEYNVSELAKEKIDKRFRELNLGDNLIAINPQAGDDWKCWNVDELVKFVKMMNKEGKKIALTGVLKDGSRYIEALNEQVGAENYLNCMDKTSIPELGALYQRCQVVISVDTGSMHMSCAVGTPTIALFFRDNHHYWGPSDCKKNPCIYNPDGISAEVVYDEVQKIVSNTYQMV